MKIEAKDLKKFELLPGETLVVRCDVNRIAAPQVRIFREGFAKMFPKNRLLIIPDTMEISNIIKAEEI